MPIIRERAAIPKSFRRRCRCANSGRSLHRWRRRRFDGTASISSSISRSAHRMRRHAPSWHCAPLRTSSRLPRDVPQSSRHSSRPLRGSRFLRAAVRRLCAYIAIPIVRRCAMRAFLPSGSRALVPQRGRTCSSGFSPMFCRVCPPSVCCFLRRSRRSSRRMGLHAWQRRGRRHLCLRSWRSCPMRSLILCSGRMSISWMSAVRRITACRF